MPRCVCIGPACIASSEDGFLKSEYCLEGCEEIKAESIVGLPPSPPDRDEQVVALYNFPQYKRLELREGGLIWYLPSRRSLGNKNYVVLLSVMTKPAPRLVSSRIFEAFTDDPTGLVFRLEKFYRRTGIDFVKVNLEKLPLGNKYFRVRMDKERKKVMFEIQV